MKFISTSTVKKKKHFPSVPSLWKHLSNIFYLKQLNIISSHGAVNCFVLQEWNL